jgi:hypothetical protein
MNSKKIIIIGTVASSLYTFRKDLILSLIDKGYTVYGFTSDSDEVAEALMYGKTILGTREAFQGYIRNSRAMLECNSDLEFIKAITELDHMSTYNELSRKIYLESYDNLQIKNELQNFLCKIND